MSEDIVDKKPAKAGRELDATEQDKKNSMRQFRDEIRSHLLAELNGTNPPHISAKIIHDDNLKLSAQTLADIRHILPNADLKRKANKLGIKLKELKADIFDYDKNLLHDMIKRDFPKIWKEEFYKLHREDMISYIKIKSVYGQFYKVIE